MKSNYKQLGQFIRLVDVRNAAGKEENLLGVSVQKTFIPSIAITFIVVSPLNILRERLFSGSS